MKTIKKILCVIIALCTILGSSSLYSSAANVLAAEVREAQALNAGSTVMEPGQIAGLDQPVAKVAEAEEPYVDPVEEPYVDPVETSDGESEEIVQAEAPASAPTYYSIEDDEKYVTINLAPDNALPAEAELQMRELKPDSFEDYDRNVYAWVESALQDYCTTYNKTVSDFIVYDLTFVKDGQTFDPQSWFNISIIYKNDDRDLLQYIDSDALHILHFNDYDVLEDVGAQFAYNYINDSVTTAITFDMWGNSRTPYIVCVLQDVQEPESEEEVIDTPVEGQEDDGQEGNVQEGNGQEGDVQEGDIQEGNVQEDENQNTIYTTQDENGNDSNDTSESNTTTVITTESDDPDEDGEGTSDEKIENDLEEGSHFYYLYDENGDPIEGSEEQGENGSEDDAAIDKKDDEESGSADDDAEIPSLEEEGPREKRIYEFDDEKVHVTAILQSPDAVPDDAELWVTPISQDSEDYNYDAYMDALNEASDESKEYTAENTLLYDIAFMVPIYEQVPIDAAEGAEFSEEEAADTVDSDDSVTGDDAAEADPAADINTAGADPAADADTAYELFEENVPVQPQASQIQYKKVIVGYYEYEPEEGAVTVMIQFKSSQLSEDLKATAGDEVEVTHLSADVQIDNAQITADDITPETVDASVGIGAEDNVLFTTDTFSVYAFSCTVVERVIDASGETYEITLTYDSDTGIPAGAQLDVQEILPESEEYNAYMKQTEAALGWEEGSASYAKLFDISIVDGEDPEIHYQPKEGTAVNVSVKLLDKEEDSEDTQVVHFPDDADEPEILDNTVEGDTVSFEGGSFSVYAIVELKKISGWVSASQWDYIINNGSKGLYVSDAEYYLSSVEPESEEVFTGLPAEKLSASIDLEAPSNAERYYFEKVEGASYQLYIYVQDDTGNKHYLKATLPVEDDSSQESEVLTGTLSFTDSEADRTPFTFHENPEDATYNIYAKSGEKQYFWTRTDGNAEGEDKAVFTVSSDRNAAARMKLYYQSNDPYGLDKKTYGIAYHDEDIYAAALMSSKKDNTKLSARQLYVRPDITDNDGVLLVLEKSSASQWTFEAIDNGEYYITTTVNKAKKYLTISQASVTLADEPAENSKIRLTPATSGDNAKNGKWQLSVGDYSLNLIDGKAGNGFNAAKGTGKTTWLNLVTDSGISDNAFTVFSAKKVSVSDSEKVSTGTKVILYTRVWNEEDTRYEFYAIDKEGRMVRCYDAGDTIKWVGEDLGTATDDLGFTRLRNNCLWEFTEYMNGDSPNGYYELQSVESGLYIAPQLSGNSPLRNGTIGIHLNGRRNGQDYTTILTWDDGTYAYSGIKPAEDNTKIESCKFSEAQDFYFAILEEPEDESGDFTTAATIDNNLYGISMKMVNYDYQGYYLSGAYRQDTQADVLGLDSNRSGLLKSVLEADGYPVAHTGKSLSQLYAGYTGSNTGSSLMPVNHLFIESIHNESGYFEFDSTKNYAYLADGTNFTVYDQLGTNQSNNSYSAFRAHGMFMPYNSLTDKTYSTALKNNTDIYTNELPDSDPRKGEKLYAIPAPYPGNTGQPGAGQADYFFGMEMDATFTQTENGLDDWGHDIIFEFSGDDDFWLYVDGILVIDLGGVHSAQSGYVNFRTGAVHYNNTNTNLRTLFTNAYTEYQRVHPEYANVSVDEYLKEIFVDDSSVFKSYTDHKMKMFYMERGAGSSNLHMRFNLAAVKPGTVILNKKVSGEGLESTDNIFAEYPYQIYYHTSEDPEDNIYHLLGDENEDDSVEYSVTYTGTNKNVKYASAYTPAGSNVEYKSVFFLQPNESAEIVMPKKTTSYYIVECGLDSDVYDVVKVNKDVVSGTPRDGSREDYQTPEYNLDTQQTVTFDNHVQDGAMHNLTFSKQLFDVEGNRLSESDDPQTFKFRLYLGTENETYDELKYVYMYTYHVKNSVGEYCRYDDVSGKFVSLGQTDFSSLDDEQKYAATFRTSINGQIANIPVDYIVEVRQLLAGTKFKVEEKSGDIPKGYSLKGYVREGEVPEHETDNSGMIHGGSTDPHIWIQNYKGWGLSVNKVWSDNAFVTGHAPIYFAIYVKDTLLGSAEIFQWTDDTKDLYWYFETLQSNTTFNDYIVREVTFETPPTVVNGVVTSYTDAPIPVADGGKLINQATSIYGYTTDFEYTAVYDQGFNENHDKNNIRTATVTNSRPGIRIWKTDMSGFPLAGAVFRISWKDEEGNTITTSDLTSDSNGLVTVADLPAGDCTLTLTEITAPVGLDGTRYCKLQHPVLIVKTGDNITVSSDNGNWCYELKTSLEDNILYELTIRNKPFTLKAVKLDENKKPLQDMKFAIYPENPSTHTAAAQPVTGYSNLQSDNNGVISDSLHNLSAGTYYLREINTPDRYHSLPDVIFTIDEYGIVSMQKNSSAELVKDTSDSNVIAYTLNVTNKLKKTTVIADKKWSDPAGSSYNPPNGTTVEFTLFKGDITQQENIVSIVSLQSNGNNVSRTIIREASGAFVGVGISNNKWKVTWENLPSYDANNAAYTYTVVETGIKDSDENDIQKLYNSVTSDPVISTTGTGINQVTRRTFTITNTLKEFSIQVEKVAIDEELSHLSGAVFTLCKMNDGNFDEGIPYSVGEEGEDKGILVIDHLTDGTYRLEETTAPAGYNGLSRYIQFEVASGELINVDLVSITDPADKKTLTPADPDGELELSEDEPVVYVLESTSGEGDNARIKLATITVGNIAGSALPSTGGIGTHLLYIIGVLLLATGSILLVLRLRKKEQ